MFENIIGYQQLTEHFTKIAIHREIPSVFMLSGATYSGKHTIATEFARVILCEQQGDWGCSCTQCAHSRMLTHPHIMCMGTLKDINEILYVSTLLLRMQTKREVFFFIRSVAKVLRRADFVIWERTEVWSRTLRSIYEELSTLLQEYRGDTAQWYSKKNILKIVTTVEKLFNNFPQQMLPIQCIRNAISWSMINSFPSSKVLIIDHAEYMLSNSANLLLKIFEEPPSQVYFILLTTNAQAILPTIRSRCQEFVLPQRSTAEEVRVLREVFKVEDIDDTLQKDKDGTINFIQFYLESHIYQDGPKTVDIHKGMQELAHVYFTSLQQKKPFRDTMLENKHVSVKKKRQGALLFLLHLTSLIETLLYDESVHADVIHNLWRHCENARMNIRQKNMSVSLVLEVLYYIMEKEYELFTQNH